MAIRSERTALFALGLASNRPLLGAVVLTALLQLAIIYVPSLNAVFRTVPLRPGEIAVCAACAVIILVIVELEKRVRNRAASGYARRRGLPGGAHGALDR
jgi:Ca2+-transporting ATPase